MLCFLLPRHSERLSGGNLYNAAFARALARRTAVERSSIDTLEQRLALPTAGVYLLDTLDLEAAELLARRAPGQRFGLLVHHLPSLEPGVRPGAPESEHERRALAHFDFWVATSEFTRALLVARGHAPERVLLAPPGAPALSPTPARVPPQPLRALVVGNLIPRKAALEWLSALAAALRPTDDFTVELIGRTDLDPAYSAACRQRLSEQPELSRRVRLVGELPHAQMAPAYDAASLLVSASQMETFGIALQEARAVGLPILALDRGNAREHVTPGLNGELVPSLDALAASFLELARDRPRFESLFVRAQTNARAGDTWDTIAKRFLDQLDAVFPARPRV
jgi:glycosyltransferase involved in cell wall biosynthesis